MEARGYFHNNNAAAGLTLAAGNNLRQIRKVSSSTYFAVLGDLNIEVFDGGYNLIHSVNPLSPAPLNGIGIHGIYTDFTQILVSSSTPGKHIFSYNFATDTLVQDFDPADTNLANAVDHIQATDDNRIIVACGSTNPKIVAFREDIPAPSNGGAGGGELDGQGGFSAQTIIVYVEQKPDVTNEVSFRSSGKTSFQVIALFAFLTSLLHVGRLRFGVGFIKFFQIIEIMSKFLFTPIWYKDILLDVMYGLGQLGDLYELDSGTLLTLNE